VGPRFAAPAPATPWLVGDVLGVVVANLVGLGMIVGGLQGARHTTDSHSLLLLVNVAAAGVVVSLAGNAVFLLSTLRQVGALRTQLLGRRPAVTAVPAQQRRTHQPASVLVAADGMTRYHRPDCPGVQGKDVRALPLGDHVAAGRQPCGLCEAAGS
jgi:hypothetical protein